jgi:hypothetical protein
MVDSTALAVFVGVCKENGAAGSKSAVLNSIADPRGLDGRRPRATAHYLFCTADDLLPESSQNARRRVTDAEVVTLCVAQAIMGIPSDRRFLAVAAKRLGHLFPDLPQQSGYFKRTRASPAVGRARPRS